MLLSMRNEYLYDDYDIIVLRPASLAEFASVDAKGMKVALGIPTRATQAHMVLPGVASSKIDFSRLRCTLSAYARECGLRITLSYYEGGLCLLGDVWRVPNLVTTRIAPWKYSLLNSGEPLFNVSQRPKVDLRVLTKCFSWHPDSKRSLAWRVATR